MESQQTKDVTNVVFAEGISPKFRHLGGRQTSSIFKQTSLMHSELMEALHYDPCTGIFTWRKKSARNTIVGSVAGCIAEGYVRIKLQKVQYQAHRLAWYYVHGAWPDLLIDHVNSVGTDNRIKNLRLVTYTGNAQNKRKIYSNNTSGYMGVSLTDGGYKWSAQIAHMGRNIELGRFYSKEEAAAAYAEAKKKLHTYQTIFD